MGYRNVYSLVSLVGLSLAMGMASKGASALSQSSGCVQDSQHEQYRWRNVKIVAGGFISGIIADQQSPGIMYARTDIGGAYRWDPWVNSWTPLTDIFSAADWNLMGTESIAVNPVEPSRIYLAQGTYTESWAGNGAILRSRDYGFSFDRVDLPIQLGANEQGRFSGERLAVDPQHHNVVYFGSRQNGLWKSFDFGATWNQVSTFPVTGPTNGVGIIFVTFEKTSDRPKKETIYVGVSDPTSGLYSSADGGATWQAVAGQPTGFLPNHYALGPDGTLYLTYGDGTGEDGMGGQRIGNGAVWKYATTNGTWTNVTPPGPWGTTSLWYGFGAAAVDAQDPNTVMVSTLGRWWPGDEVYRSIDGGTTWIPLGSEPDTGLNYAVRDDSMSPYLNFGTGCTGNTCDTTLATFGWWIGALAIDPFDSNHVLYGTGATIWASDDVTNVDAKQMTHWEVGADGIEETAVQQLISPPAGAHLISGVGDIGGFRHDDFNVSPPGGMFNNPVFSTTTGLDYAEKSPAIVARVGWGNAQHGAWSQDGGTTWTPFANDAANASNGPGAIAISADGARFVWSPSSGNPSWSIDSGATWTAAIGAPAQDMAIADRVNPSKFYLLDPATGTVYVSTDGSVNFKAAASGLPNGGQLRAAPDHEGDLWLAASSGLYRSTDSGTSFVNIGSVSQADAVGFGMAAPHENHPSLYLSGHVNDVIGIFRSTDQGRNWVRINDDHHQWGWIGVVTGDPRVFGRVYLGTNGRGVVVGDSRDMDHPNLP